MPQMFFLIANLIAFTCAMKMWQFDFSIRIMGYDVLCVVFICLYTLNLVLGKKIYLNKQLKNFILLLWLVIIVECVSGFQILSTSKIDESAIQFLKTIIENVIHGVFFSCFILYLSTLSNDRRNSILNFFIAGSICSAVYGIIHMVVWLKYNISIDSYLWGLISYNVDFSVGDTMDWGVWGVPRGRGFPGVNAAATYYLTALPLVLLSTFLSYKTTARMRYIIFFLILLAGLLLTMSRTGLVGFVISISLILFVMRRRFTKIIIPVTTICLLIFYGLWVIRDFLFELIIYRTGGSNRLDLLKGALALFYKNPLFGVGANNYSVVRHSLDPGFFTDANLHNSWMNILVEQGLVGLLTVLLFYGYILYVTFRNRTMISRAYIASMFGLLASACLNEIFSEFFFNFFVIFFFSLIVLEPSDNPITY